MASEKIDVYQLSQQDYYVLEEMITANPKILTTKDSNDRLLLHWAALGGRDRLVEFILNQPNAPNVDIADDTQATPLILATLKGSLSCVRFLASKGANINAKNWQGHSPIQYACSKGHQDIVEFLLKNGVDPNVCDNRNDTPLHRLATLGKVEIMKLLLNWPDVKIELDLQNKEGNTPLHLACEDEQFDCVKLLLEKGARVDLQNKEEKTPLDFCKPGLQQEIRQRLGLTAQP